MATHSASAGCRTCVAVQNAVDLRRMLDVSPRHCAGCPGNGAGPEQPDPCLRSAIPKDGARTAQQPRHGRGVRAQSCSCAVMSVRVARCVPALRGGERSTCDHLSFSLAAQAVEFGARPPVHRSAQKRRSFSTSDRKR